MRLVRSGLIGGLTLASLHFVWVLLVAIGWAQWFLDWIFQLHMLSSPFQVQPFQLSLAATLILITFLIGCFYGLVFEVIRKLLIQPTRD